MKRINTAILTSLDEWHLLGRICVGILIVLSVSLLWARPAAADAKACGFAYDSAGFPYYPYETKQYLDGKETKDCRDLWFTDTAALKLRQHHRVIAPDENVLSTFRANLDFPTGSLPPNDMPWKDLHPIHDAEAYLENVLNYTLDACGAPHVDFDGTKCGWFHAPWMHDLREPMRGLTRERSSRLGELHPSQTTKSQNWAVSLYNDIGGHGFGRIWLDYPAQPKTKDFSFEAGTVAVKLLFSLATPEQVPYLRFAKTWDIHDGTRIVKARLIQVDLLVKDDRLKDGLEPAPNHDLTGWLMGSYLYNGAIETVPRCDTLQGDTQACEESRWRDRLVLIGSQWGNDPQIYETSDPDEKTPVQHKLNDDVTQMFANIRSMSGHPTYLGRDGRMNGPVDNHRSTCLACHGRAVDFGRYEKDWLRYVPFVPADDATDAELKKFFRNLDSDVPFVEGTQSLDYSLQAALGVHKFREWVHGLEVLNTLKLETRNVVPSYRDPYPVTGELKIVTWNIANLHHEDHVPLRSGAVPRQPEDYAILRDFAEAKFADADVIALQEVGSPTALKRILPENKYHLIMSDRYTPGDEFKPLEKRSIYTALALSKTAFPVQPPVTTLDVLSVTHIDYHGGYNTLEMREARAGMVVEFELERPGKGPQKVSFLNVHLKSGCREASLREPDEIYEPTHLRYDCRTIIAQMEVLENWIEQQQDLDRMMIIGGDFNRTLNGPQTRTVLEEVAGGKKEKVVTVVRPVNDYWADLNDGHKLTLLKGPADSDDICWPKYKKRHKKAVDFFVLDSFLTRDGQTLDIKHIGYEQDDVPGYNGKPRERLSDHCPVIMILAQP